MSIPFTSTHDVTGASIDSAIDGHTFTSATITASDTILFQDADDSNNTKVDTVQGILDLAGGGGAWELVSTTNASNATSVDFTGLSSGYIYMLVIDGMKGNGGSGGPRFRVSTDNGSTFDTGSNYAYDQESRYGGGNQATNGGNPVDHIRIANVSIANGSSDNLKSIIYLYDVGTSGRFFMNCTFSYWNTSTHGVGYSGGVWFGTGTVDAVRVYLSANNIDGDFYFYRLTKS